MFLNASIQGLYRTGRLFAEDYKKAAALITATVVAPEIALYFTNARFPEYSLVPDQVKQLNFLLPILNFELQILPAYLPQVDPTLGCLYR